MLCEKQSNWKISIKIKIYKFFKTSVIGRPVRKWQYLKKLKYIINDGIIQFKVSED